MTDEERLRQLVSIVDALGLTDSQRWALALVIGELMLQSWQEGWDWGSRIGGDDEFRTQHLTKTSIISH